MNYERKGKPKRARGLISTRRGVDTPNCDCAMQLAYQATFLPKTVNTSEAFVQMLLVVILHGEVS